MIEKLIKIGGAAIQNKNDFINLIEIINKQSSFSELIVISAFSKATRNLRFTADIALTSDFESAVLKLDEIFSFLESLSLVSLDLRDNYEYLWKILKGINLTRELTPRILDRILAMGELLSTEVVKQNIFDNKICFVNAFDLILTDSQFNNANPDYESSKEKSLAFFSECKSHKILTQGFIAKDLNGNLTTMGYESSNLTATLLADFLSLKELTILTNVDGIRNFDPQLNNSHQLVQNLNYSDALALANYGLNLLYAPMIKIAKERSINIEYRNINHNSCSTMINMQKSSDKSILIVNYLNKSNILDDVSTRTIFSISDSIGKINFYTANNSNFKIKADFIQYYIYNCDVSHFILYFLNNFNIEDYNFDNFAVNSFRIIGSSENYQSDLEKLIRYINNDN